MLLQEKYKKDRWKLLVSCVLLNMVKDTKAHGVAEKLFEICETPEDFLEIEKSEIINIIKPLGLYNRRYESILSISTYLTVHNENDKYYEQMLLCRRGIGKYACDSYEIFYTGNMNVQPKDKELINYLKEHKIS